MLCIEILSSNRSHDQVTKLAKYAEAGLEHYWILDPKLGSMDLLVLDGQHYRLVTTIGRGGPSQADFGAASVTIDLEALLA